ncbi:HAMP domain-containing histidine kinase, partial [bacterium]|nr:HAMP domain-containing histidine kinase [bacterium]
NSKFISNARKNSLFELTDFMLNKNVKKNIIDFKNSENNHIFFKLIIKENKALQNVPVNLHISKIKNNNKIVGYTVIIQDILQEVTNKIQKATFVDIISHDLKNPMRANIQILELILKNKFGQISSVLRPVLDELLSSCRFMNYMADNLLIKYKNEFEMYELKKQQYSIVKLIKDVCGKVNNLLDRKKQSVELVICGNIADVNIDIKEMSKVINNLIINASEQSKENSKIIIQVENKNKNIKISFTNYGYSKSKSVLDNMFEEYLSCSNKFRKVGFSLELYNCKKIIEAHNGNIFAKSISDNETSIVFSLPVI